MASAQNSLKWRVTKKTICKIADEEYLLQRINGLENPILVKGATARQSILDATAEAVSMLHWRDFETLVDIIFARSGWNRISSVGGNQKLIDIELQQPMTNERLAVQVKSEASQATLDQYISRIDEAGQFHKFMFICHSEKGPIAGPKDRKDIEVWSRRDVAEAVFRTGLYDWVMEKC